MNILNKVLDQLSHDEQMIILSRNKIITHYDHMELINHTTIKVLNQHESPKTVNYVRIFLIDKKYVMILTDEGELFYSYEDSVDTANVKSVIYTKI